MSIIHLIADDGVSKAPLKTDTGEGLTFRRFTVYEGFFREPFDKNGDAQHQLTAKGVRFSPGTSATYLPREQKLIIINTSDQVELVGELIDAGKRSIQTQKGTVFVPVDK